MTDLRLVPPAEPIPFERWDKDPIALARLYRWLVLMDEAPRDVAGFLEHAESWGAQYQAMLDWTDDHLPRSFSRLNHGLLNARRDGQVGEEDRGAR